MMCATFNATPANLAEPVHVATGSEMAALALVFLCLICFLEKLFSVKPNLARSYKGPPLIAFCGLKGAGKDTAAGTLARHGFTRASFAGGLKDIVATAFRWPRCMLEGNTQKSRVWRKTVDPYWAEALGDPAFTPVRALQLWGTDLVRDNFHADFWVLSLMNRIDRGQVGARVAITDTRFPNEVAAIKARGGLVIRLERGPNPEWCDALVSGMDPDEIEGLPHESEWKSVGYEDVVIKNNGTVEDLDRAIQFVVKQMAVN